MNLFRSQQTRKGRGGRGERIIKNPQTRKVHIYCSIAKQRDASFKLPVLLIPLPLLSRIPRGPLILLLLQTLLPKIHQTHRSHPPILLLNILLNPIPNMILLTRQTIRQLLHGNPIPDQILVHRTCLVRVVCCVEGVATDIGWVVVARGLNFHYY